MLEAQSTYAALQRLAGEQGDSFTKSAPALWKALGERGLIVKDGGQNTVKRRIMGELKRVLCLQAQTLEIAEKSQAPTSSDSRDFRDTSELGVSDSLQPVPASQGVPEMQQGRQKVRDGLGAVSHGKEVPVPEVPAAQNTTPTSANFLEGEL